MANIPHGGVLKVCSLPLLLSYSWQRDLQVDVILSLSKDLLARDAGIHHLLKEESLTLNDIVLSEVCAISA